MMGEGLFGRSLNSAKKLRNLIIFFALTHIVFLVFGQWVVAQKYPMALELRAEQLKELKDLPYLKPLVGVLADHLILKILYTFAFNLIFGAFLSTTVMGAIFFMPYLIAVWRGFIIGLLVYGTDTTPAMIAVFYGTFILEFGAYCFSSAVGTDFGLSLLNPQRKGTASRAEALKSVFRNGAGVYLLVTIILFISAIWEITWLHYLGPMVKPGPLP